MSAQSGPVLGVERFGGGHHDLAVSHTARWDIEVLFSDTKDLLGLDQYQLMTVTAIVCFWTLVMAAYIFLGEERSRLRHTRQTHVTIGDARREVQRWHWHHLLDWIHLQFSSGVTPNELFPTLAA